MLIDKLNLNELRIFVAVFENLSMTKAGEILGLTQSGISQHIIHLENVLQIKLFDRVNKRIVPTQSARELFEACRNHLGHIESALANLHEEQKHIVGKVAIGMPIEFGNNLLMPSLAKFCIANPGVDLQIRVGFASEMNSLLLTGELDFAFVDSYNLAPEIMSEKVFDEILCLCCSPDYLTNRKAPKNVEDFEDFEFIEYQKGNPLLKMWFEQEFGIVPRKFKVRAYVMDVQGVAKLIKSGLGCGVLPVYLVENFQKQGIPLTVFDDVQKKVHNIISVAQIKNKSLSPAARNLRSFLLEKLYKRRTKSTLPREASHYLNVSP